MWASCSRAMGSMLPACAPTTVCPSSARANRRNPNCPVVFPSDDCRKEAFRLTRPIAAAPGSFSSRGDDKLDDGHGNDKAVPRDNVVLEPTTSSMQQGKDQSHCSRSCGEDADGPRGTSMPRLRECPTSGRSTARSAVSSRGCDVKDRHPAKAVALEQNVARIP
jgi:hypothetical protein